MDFSRTMAGLNQDLDEELNRWIDEVPVRLHIDDHNIELESDEQDRSGGELNIHIDLGIRDILKRHPEEYNEELHYTLFNDIERLYFENYKK